MGLRLGVNPFDQPGVEAYKTRMFELLGKPGYEKYLDSGRRGKNRRWRPYGDGFWEKDFRYYG